MTYEACAEHADRTITLNDADARIAVLRNRIRDLGGVNVNAAEEYDAANASTARSDCTARRSAKRARRSAAHNRRPDQPDEPAVYKSVQALKRAFRRDVQGAVRRRQCKADFAGSEGDALNCGIDIAAQPPGKKLQMLSAPVRRRACADGHRDTVRDAGHDVPRRFAYWTRSRPRWTTRTSTTIARVPAAAIPKSTQFIVVTHRKGTMECCDTLYGVAMEEKGVSRMVSVALADAQRSV